MANDNKAVGPLASARLVTLIKAETAKKLDKTGGTLTGDLTISGAWLNVKSTDTGDGNISVDGSLVAGRGVSVLNDDKYVSLVCTGDNAAKIAGSGNNCARLAVGTPTGDNDAATKAYVDAAAGATVYVDFWPTSSDVEYIETFKAYVADLAASQTFDSVFDLVNTGNTVVARLYDNSNKANLVAESIETGISGDKELGNINFLFMNAATGTPFGLPTISDAIWLTKTNNNTVAYALYRYCPLPLPASDNSDTGKVPTINGKKWELKKPESTTTVDDAMSSTSTNPVQNKVVKAALDGKLSTLGGNVNGSLSLTRGITVGRAEDDTGIHLYKDGVGVAKMTSGSADVDDTVSLARLKVASPTEDDDAATKAYVDNNAAGAGAVRYDAKQALTFEQKKQARKNIEAADSVWPTITGGVSLCPEHITDSNFAVHVETKIASGEDYTVTFDGGPENVLVRVYGIRTPTDTDTNAAATVEYVKNKVSEVSSSGGVTVDTAMSNTSTNPVQNKTIKQYVDDHAVSLPLTLTYANGHATGATYTDIRKAIERGRQIKLAVANTIDIIASNARNETNKSVLKFTNTDVGGDTVNISQYIVTAQASGLTCNVKSHELA